MVWELVEHASVSEIQYLLDVVVSRLYQPEPVLEQSGHSVEFSLKDEVGIVRLQYVTKLQVL